MSAGAIISMILILSVVGGGFIFFLAKAIKKEQNGQN
ncbi:MAG: MetS family NSS transporter small subunit [Bacteroidota bacterium]